MTDHTPAPVLIVEGLTAMEVYSISYSMRINTMQGVIKGKDFYDLSQMFNPTQVRVMVRMGDYYVESPMIDFDMISDCLIFDVPKRGE